MRGMQTLLTRGRDQCGSQNLEKTADFSLPIDRAKDRGMSGEGVPCARDGGREAPGEGVPLPPRRKIVLVMFYCMHARCMHLDACVLYACMHLCVLYCSQRGYRVNLEPRFFAVGACGSEPYGRLTSWQPPLLRDARTTHEWRMRHCPPVFLRSRVVTRRSIGDRP